MGLNTTGICIDASGAGDRTVLGTPVYPKQFTLHRNQGDMSNVLRVLDSRDTTLITTANTPTRYEWIRSGLYTGCLCKVCYECRA
jgi:hypothetical protein